MAAHRVLRLGFVCVLAIIMACPIVVLAPAHVPARAAPATIGPMAEWTFLVYLDADNNLEPYGIDDFNEMEAVGSTPAVNIVVQFDRADAEAAGGADNDDTSNGDWTGTKRFYVTKDADAALIGSQELADLGELNMGDPAVLREFLSWGMSAYPAQRYALVLWDHGGAFWGVCWDDTSNNGTGDALTMPELQAALQPVVAQRGAKLDLLGFDACLMAQVAVLYQLKDSVGICCASGYVVPGNGWPYDLILDPLVATPTLTAREFGVIICDEYVTDYTDREPDNAFAVTMTAFDFAKMDRLALRLDELAMELAENARLHNVQLRLARANTASYDMAHVGPFDFTGYCMYDVIDFATKASNLIPADVGVQSAATALQLAVVDSIVVAEVDRFHASSGAHGLTLYFPSGNDPYASFITEYDPQYDELQFAQERYWDDFLHDYLALQNAGNTPPSVSIDEPALEAVHNATDGFLALSGLAFDVQNNPEVSVAVVPTGGTPTASDWLHVAVSTPAAGEVQWRHELEVSDLGGEYTIHVRARDPDGLYSETITRTFSIVPAPTPPKPLDYALVIYGVVAIVAVLVFVALMVQGWKKHRA